MNLYTAMMAAVLLLAYFMRGDRPENKSYIWLSCFLMFALCGLRDVYTLGNDSASSYVRIFHEAGALNWAVAEMMDRYHKLEKKKVKNLDEYNAALAEKIVTRKPDRLGNDNYALDLVRAEVDHILGLLDTQDRRIKDEIIFSGGLKVTLSM